MSPKTGGPDTASNPGLVYDPFNHRMVAWLGGTDVYLMDPATLLSGTGVWSRTTYRGAVPVPTTLGSGGVSTRMQYAPEFRGFVVAPGEEAGVFSYELPAGAELTDCNE